MGNNLKLKGASFVGGCVLLILGVLEIVLVCVSGYPSWWRVLLLAEGFVLAACGVILGRASAIRLWGRRKTP